MTYFYFLDKDYRLCRSKGYNTIEQTVERFIYPNIWKAEWMPRPIEITRPITEKKARALMIINPPEIKAQDDWKPSAYLLPKRRGKRKR